LIGGQTSKCHGSSIWLASIAAAVFAFTAQGAGDRVIVTVSFRQKHKHPRFSWHIGSVGGGDSTLALAHLAER